MGVRSSGGSWNTTPIKDCIATVMVHTAANVDCRQINGCSVMGSGHRIRIVEQSTRGCFPEMAGSSNS